VVVMLLFFVCLSLVVVMLLVFVCLSLWL
jgi:hypothetical protein